MLLETEEKMTKETVKISVSPLLGQLGVKIARRVFVKEHDFFPDDRCEQCVSEPLDLSITCQGPQTVRQKR